MQSTHVITAMLLAGSSLCAAEVIPPIAEQRAQLTCEILYPPGAEPTGETRGAYVPWTWTDGLMFYEFASNISSTNRTRVRNAMNLIENVSPIRFIEREDDEENYILIQSLGGNFSYVGMLGGAQDLSLFNYNLPYVIVHELTHALGRYHTQQRTDRDNYVQVNYGCIASDCYGNYNIAGGGNYLPYDFLSVMHYGDYDCSTGCQTMTCQPGYEQYQNQIGNATYMSTSDVQTLNFLYPGGSPDPTVLFCNVSATEVQPGDTVSVTAVIKNDGDWGITDIYGRIQLSEDDEITTGDQFLGFELYDYLFSGGFAYVNKQVVIPASTPDGTYYVGVLVTTSDDDADEGNNTCSVAIQVGDVAEPCPGDIDGDGTVDVTDLLNVIANWGDPYDVSDLLEVIASWGPCS